MIEVVNFRMNKDVKNYFKKICKNQNITMSSRINDLIIDFLKEFKVENTKVENRKVVKKEVKDWRDLLVS
jgi:hypothetical protein